MTRLAGKVALVTGTTSGSGGAILERFATEGARAVGADWRAEGGEEVAAAIRARGGGARHRPGGG